MSKESLENKILSWSKKFIKSLKDYELIEIIRSENLSKTNSDNIKEFQNYGNWSEFGHIVLKIDSQTHLFRGFESVVAGIAFECGIIVTLLYVRNFLTAFRYSSVVFPGLILSHKDSKSVNSCSVVSKFVTNSLGCIFNALHIVYKRPVYLFGPSLFILHFPTNLSIISSLPKSFFDVKQCGVSA